MKIDKAFSTSIPRTLLSLMIFCAVALGAVVFLQNLEIDQNAKVMQSQGLEVQQKNNTFLINLECVNGSVTSGSIAVPQDKITSCIVANQNIGDYIAESKTIQLDNATQGNSYNFTDVMAVVDACSTQKNSSETNAVKFQQGKSLEFHCPSKTSETKENLKIVSFK